MSTHDQNKKTGRTTALLPDLPDMGQSAKRASQNVVQRVFRHLNKRDHRSSTLPSEAQRQLVVTGFILGVVSILTAIFPICGLPTSIGGLLIGLYGRRKSPALRTMTSWAIMLSLGGLALSLLYLIIIAMNTYVNGFMNTP